MIITIFSVILILTGLFFFVGAAVGVMRFPDFYCRMHAAGKGDTLSTLLVILGFALYQFHEFESFAEHWPIILVVLKLMAILVFIFLTSPTSTGALADAGWEDGIDPIIEGGRPNHLADDFRPNPTNTKDKP